MTILLTGAYGFIGANLVHALNARGETDLLVVDNLSRAEKFHNLTDAEFGEFIDKTSFIELVRRRAALQPSLVFHQGACSDTMEQDGRYMMENNYRYSIELLRWCQELRIPFVYASSASVYGMGTDFIEDRSFEAPLNVYGYSKFAFDQFVRRMLSTRTAPVVGLRYFNVYGPRESHKGRMASVAFHHVNQFRVDGRVRLFEGSHGYAAGEQRRDFIHVDDVVAGNLHFGSGPDRSGIYNLGTGRAQSFNDVALTVVNAMRELDADAAVTASCRSTPASPASPVAPTSTASSAAPLSLPQAVAAGSIEYIPFPDALRGKYQAYTQADVTQLRASGFDAPMSTVQDGTARYVRWLLGQAPR